MTEPITPTATKAALDDPNRQIAVIDVREPLNYSEGHIYESTPVPRSDLEVRLPSVVPSGQATIVIVDRAGERAAHDADWLEFLGYPDVRFMQGGMAAWTDAGLEIVDAHDGVYATAFNFPSKDFGEQVEVEDEPERLGPAELQAMREDEDVLLADVRTPEEYEESTVPGALHVEGVDLSLYLDRLRDGSEPVVVHCGGRTRSIIGTSTLEKLGYEDVYELENGTMGWELAGNELEHGADRHVRDLNLEKDVRADLRERTDDLLDDTGVGRLSVATVRNLLDDEEVTYLVDVRTTAEYKSGHLPGSLSIPGGQAIQTTDEHFPVRNGTIVFLSDDGVRAAITAYWFDRMGFPHVFILEGGLEAWKEAGESLKSGQADQALPGLDAVDELATQISSTVLEDLQQEGTLLVVDIDASERFIDGHVPGAQWVPRSELDEWLETEVDRDKPVVLTSREGKRARYAAAAMVRYLDRGNVRWLAGGTAGWAESGRKLETGESGLVVEPRDNVPKPYHQGDWAKQTYLEWEEALGEKYN
jgi:rhodanese-related sulfurtransferase